MADGKYLSYDDTNKAIQEVGAIDASTGAADANKLVKTNAAGQLDASLIPNVDSVSLVAAETITAGRFVAVFDDGGVPSARLADASTIGMDAIGFSGDNYVAGDTVSVIGSGTVALSGLTINQEYFLSATTPGEVTPTPPTTSGHFVQRLGKATSTTILKVDIEETVIIRG